MSRNLNDFLKQAGVVVAGAQPAAAPVAPVTKTAAPVAKTKVADIAPSMPSTEAAGGKEPRKKNTEDNKQDTGATGGDTAAAATKGASMNKTAAQLALSRKGINIEDAKIAQIAYDALVVQGEQQKQAELEKCAAELRAQGALMYQGMCIESTAMKLATGEATIEDAKAVAALCSVNVGDLIKRAEQLQAATSSPALIGGMLGSAARVDSSRVMEAAERNGGTTETRDIEAISGTRAAVSDSGDDKLKRFVDVMVLPGNPGLNHGQVVDQGKKLGQ